MRIKRESVKSGESVRNRRLRGAFLAGLRKQGQFWLELLRSLSNLQLGPALSAMFLVGGVLLVFLALMVMPILGLAVAAAAGLYIYATRDQYLPVLNYDWKRDYDPDRTTESQRARRAGYDRRGSERRARRPLPLLELFNRIAVITLLGVGVPVTAIANGFLMGMIASLTLAVALLALADPDSFRVNGRRVRRARS